jgi:hypothetical protein
MSQRTAISLAFVLLLGAGHPVFAQSILDRVVGADRRGRPLEIGWLNVPGISALAEASGTPMGIEMRLSEPLTRLGVHGVTVTGMRLGDALAAVSAIDPRYEWRELNGVVVFRPVQAWGDATDPLFLPVTALDLEDVTLSTIVGAITSALGSPEPANNSIPDTRRLSVSVNAGSVLDLLNAAAAAHGKLCWAFEEIRENDRRQYGDRRYNLMVFVFKGNGWGFFIR